MADSHRCMAETNTALQSNHPPIKKKFFFKVRHKSNLFWISVVVQCLRLCLPMQSPNSIPDWTAKIPHATQCSQNIKILEVFFKKKKKKGKIDRQQEFAISLQKLEQGLCINLERWDGEGDGREVQKGGDICIPMAHSC